MCFFYMETNRGRTATATLREFSLEETVMMKPRDAPGAADHWESSPSGGNLEPRLAPLQRKKANVLEGR